MQIKHIYLFFQDLSRYTVVIKKKRPLGKSTYLSFEIQKIKSNKLKSLFSSLKSISVRYQVFWSSLCMCLERLGFLQ